MDGFPDENFVNNFRFLTKTPPLSYPSFSDTIQSRLIFPVQIVYHGLEHYDIAEIIIISVLIINSPCSRTPLISCWCHRPYYTHRYIRMSILIWTTFFLPDRLVPWSLAFDIFEHHVAVLITGDCGPGREIIQREFNFLPNIFIRLYVGKTFS